MRTRPLAVSFTLVALLATTPVWAEQHVASDATLQQALQQQQTTDAANRRAVLEALRRDEVKSAAARLGLNVRDAETAVRTMSSDELAALASPAHAVNAQTPDLAGGSSEITISVTTLLLLLILLVLIAK